MASIPSPIPCAHWGTITDKYYRGRKIQRKYHINTVNINFSNFQTLPRDRVYKSVPYDLIIQTQIVHEMYCIITKYRKKTLAVYPFHMTLVQKTGISDTSWTSCS